MGANTLADPTRDGSHCKPQQLGRRAQRDGAGTRLGRAIAPLLDSHANLSGVVALQSGRNAFAMRMRLADAAERSLDARYYLWHRDLTGTLLLDALRRAADRGVRVRLLLDDYGTSGMDDILAALNTHENIEIRLFNPFKFRKFRLLGFLFHFARLDRRMHNKSFTVDDEATVIGGRNVGNEYFGADRDDTFIDLDVLAIGPVVDAVSSDFERYWNCACSRPVGDILPPVAPERILALKSAAASLTEGPAALTYMSALDESPFVKQLLAHALDFEWTQVQMMSDDPAKGLGMAPDDELLWTRLKRVIKHSENALKLISAYFVPAAEGQRFFSAMAAGGVEVAVLTNSLEANNVPIVHAGYTKRRKALLEAGVVLYEFKKSSSTPLPASHATTGSSGSTLHAKTFSIDGARIFIGSFNFDPRSARLNTEMGFLIESPALAQSVVDSFARSLPQHAYEVRLTPERHLIWIEHRKDKEIVHTTEPGAGMWKRFWVLLLSKLPIEWLL